jgi:hypothetical protein
VNFEAYLESKKIDSTAFKAADPKLWESWKTEFDAMHPNSFTVQKLNLINPIRRLYKLPVVEKVIEPVKEGSVSSVPSDGTAPPAVAPVAPKPVMNKPAVPRPVFKPKPKTE